MSEIRKRGTGMDIGFHVQFSPHRLAYNLDIFVSSRSLNTPTAYATGVIMKTLAMHERPPDEPALRLEQHEAQNLMDELWRAGIRPTNGAGSSGQLAATERHLEDMRALTNRLVRFAAPLAGEPDGPLYGPSPIKET